MKQLFIAWTPFMRRPESMQQFFGYELHFIAISFSKRWMKPLEYAVKLWITLRLLLLKKPDVLWVQVAPTFLLYVAHLYKAIFRRDLTVIADCHNSMYRKPWVKLPGAIRLLNGCDKVLVHNHKVMLNAMRLGVQEKRLTVLETKPASLQKLQQTASAANEGMPRPWLLLPCSFDTDEPIDKVVAAARFIPHITIVITGNPAKYKGGQDLSNLPPNVRLAGFLPKSQYNELLQTCDFVMGITTRDDVQLSVANEAVGAGKPMVISGSALQRELFYSGAIYVDPLDPDSIADGCMEALERLDQLRLGIERLRRERNERWFSQAQMLKELRKPQPLQHKPV